MMLALVAFSMSMVGTFLVRSGILTSVHAFAVDPTRGTFILVLLTLYVGAALTLFAVRIATVKEGAPFDPLSREGALVANNLLLSVILGIVLVGTLYPLIAEAATGEKLSVGPPYFNATAGPLALMLAAVMLIGPQLRWRSDRAAVLPRLGPGAVVAIAALVATFLLAPSIHWLPRLGLALGAGLIPASIAPLIGRSLRRTPLATWGMCLAHLGVAVALIGMASDSAFTRERLTTAAPGETIAAGPWLVEFRSILPVAGPNWTALEAELRASRGGGVTILKPQSRFFTEPATTTSEAAIETDWNGQLYAVLGAQDPDSGRWQLRLWWKPFVTLIWLGGALIALGGLLALVGRWWRAWRTRRRLVEAEW
jgi:cytochrome c-type biogenesis protein CcmF